MRTYDYVLGIILLVKYIILFPVTILTTIIVRFSYEGRLHVLAIPAARSGATAGAGANGAPASGKRRDAAIVAATHTQK